MELCSVKGLRWRSGDGQCESGIALVFSHRPRGARIRRLDLQANREFNGILTQAFWSKFASTKAAHVLF